MGRHVDTADLNRIAWSHPEQVDAFARVRGWNDPSERRIVIGLRSAGGLGDVCDVGVGGGRTVSLLAGAASTYVAVDFMPEMVQAATERFAGVDIRLGDARHLEFADARFDLVVFSSNGLDALGHEDRMLALTEIRRVLRTRGRFLFSSHNHLGPARGNDRGVCRRSISASPVPRPGRSEDASCGSDGSARTSGPARRSMSRDPAGRWRRQARPISDS